MAKWVDPLEDAGAEIKALRYMVECLDATVQKAEAENERLRLALVDAMAKAEKYNEIFMIMERYEVLLRRSLDALCDAFAHGAGVQWCGNAELARQADKRVQDFCRDVYASFEWRRDNDDARAALGGTDE